MRLAKKRKATGQPVPRDPSPDYVPTKAMEPIPTMADTPDRSPPPIDKMKQAHRVRTVTFGILTPEAITNGSACELTSGKTHIRGEALDGGLLDPRMGPTKAGEMCTTCNQEYSLCPGHHAHLPLAVPLFNIEYTPILIKVLRSVCFGCSRLLLKQHQYESRLQAIRKIGCGKERLNAIAAASKSIRYCGNAHTDVPNNKGLPCGTRQVVYTYIKREGMVLVQQASDVNTDTSLSYSATGTDGSPCRLTCSPYKMRSILAGIPPDDVVTMGLSVQYSHPRNMMWTVLYIPPPNVRPGRGDKIHEPQARRESDLTKRLKSIVRYEHILRKSLQEKGRGTAGHELPNLVDTSTTSTVCPVFRAWRDLQIAIGSYQNCAVIVKGGGQYGKLPDSIRNRFQGQGGAKKYRVRGTILSVRTNQSARGVIVPSNFSNPSVVGVPRWMCMSMTYPETVAKFNRDRLMAAVKNGPDKYPGAQYAISPSGTLYDLKARLVPPIEEGWIIRRHLVTGDNALINRQPSLHKQSVLGMKIAEVSSGDAIHMHPVLCKALAADYDGDEINLYACQSTETRVECELLAGVAENMLKDSRPVVGFMQHSALFYYLLTVSGGRQIAITRRNIHDAMYTFVQTATEDLYGVGNSILCALTDDGKDLHGSVVDGFDFISMFLPTDMAMTYNGTVIRAGRFVTKSVPINMKTLNEGILATIYTDYGGTPALRFLGGMCAVANRLLNVVGCSITYDDCVPDVRSTKASHASAASFLGQVEGVFERLDKHLQPDAEHLLVDCLDAARENISQAAVDSIRARTGRNGLLDIIDSQTKGSPANLASMLGILGQQFTSTHERQELGIGRGSGGYSTRFGSAGFIDRSFATGLTPLQYFHHLAAARSSVVNVSVHTASTGFIARKLAIFLQDMYVGHLGEVRSETGQIVQLRYGDDGFSSDGVSQTIRFVGMTLEDTFKHFWFLPDAPQQSSTVTDQQACLRAAENELGRILYLQNIFKVHQIGPVYMSCPVHFERLLQRAAHHGSKERSRAVTIYDAEESALRAWDVVKAMTRGAPCVLLAAAFWDSWTHRNICKDLRLDSTSIEWAIRTMRDMLHVRTVPMGTPVGIIAAQYATEPMTQANLSSTHSVGRGPGKCGDISSVVSRLIGLSSANGDHITQARLRPGESAEHFAQTIVHYTLREFVLGAAEQPEYTASDAGGTELHMCKPPAILELTLDRAKLLAAQMLPDDLFRKIQSSLLKRSSSPAHLEYLRPFVRELDSTWVMKLRYVPHDRWDLGDGQDSGSNYGSVYSALAQLSIGGMPNIRACTVHRESEVYVQGNNLLGLFLDQRIVPSSIQSSDINAVYELLGIDAAATAIFGQWTSILRDVSPKHLRLLADAMCYKGSPLPVNTRGLADAPVMKRASLEKSVENILYGALFGTDGSHTTTTSTYCGAMCWNGILGSGTGCVTIFDEPSVLPAQVRTTGSFADAGYRGRSYAESSVESEQLGTRDHPTNSDPSLRRGRLSNGVDPFRPWVPLPRPLP